MTAVTALLIAPTAVLLAAALTTLMLRGGSASVRHAIWMAALTAAFLAPLTPALPPAFTISLFQTSPDSGPVFQVPPGVLEEEAPETTAKAGGGPRLRAATTALGARRWLALVWLTGVLIVCARTLVGIRFAWRLSRRAQEHGTPQWQALLADLQYAMRVPVAVRLRISADRVPPLTCGLLRPTVLLPSSARHWSAETVRLTLAHELAHVKRRDVLQHLLVQACCALHWFNPLAWYAARRVRIERERACDDAVLGLGASADDYAEHLIAMARGARALSAGVVPIVGRSDLETRLWAILDPGVRRHSLSRGGNAVMMAIALSVTLSIGSVRAVGQPRSQPDAAAQARAAAACEMGRRGDPGAIPALVNLLGDDAPAAAIECTGEGGWQTALSSLKHPSPGEQAAIALASFSQPAFEALLGALASGDPTVRRNAAWAIGELRSARGLRLDRRPAVDPLIGALSDADSWVRTAAAFSLGELKATAAIDALIAVLGDADANARMMAARALGEMKTRRAVDALRLALADADPRVRGTAQWALAEIR